jgi:hypothetical protein
MILEEWMIECRLFGDGHTVYDISILALFIFMKSVHAIIKVERKLKYVDHGFW